MSQPKRTATAQQARLLLDVRLRPLLAALLEAPQRGRSVGELTELLGGEAGRPSHSLLCRTRPVVCLL